jgi:hypothetical protein
MIGEKNKNFWSESNLFHYDESKKLKQQWTKRVLQLNFAPKIVGRNFADSDEFPPNHQIFGWDIGRNSPKSEKIVLTKNYGPQF